MKLERSQQRRLLGLAYESIELGLRAAGPVPWRDTLLDEELRAHRASFTTLSVAGALRGCCGSIDAARPLAEDVWQNAWASAFRDPRFQPLHAAEFAQLELRISVLGPLEPFTVAGEAELIATLRPGRDGLVLELGATRVTFLPAVWEQLPAPQAFVQQLKRKAGWPASFWSGQLRAYRYATHSFGDGEA